MLCTWHTWRGKDVKDIIKLNHLELKLCASLTVNKIGILPLIPLLLLTTHEVKNTKKEISQGVPGSHLAEPETGESSESQVIALFAVAVWPGVLLVSE